MMPDSPFNVARMVVSVIAVLAVSTLTSITLTTSAISDHLEAQLDRFGNGIVTQLSDSLVEHLVNDDLLGLNVTLKNGISQDHFDFAVVYGADGGLIAQAGASPEGNIHLFTADIFYQNTIVGHVQVGLSSESAGTSVLGIAATLLTAHIILILGFLAVLRTHGFRRWLTVSVPTQAPEPAGTYIATPDPARMQRNSAWRPRETPESCTLASVRILPARLASRQRARLQAAATLYGGSIHSNGTDEYTIRFNKEDHAYLALCTSLLLKKLLETNETDLVLKMGIHTTEVSELQSARKHASYLASLSENLPLASRKVFETSGSEHRVIREEFHHAAVPEGDVFIVMSLVESGQRLIDQQATQLSAL